MTTLRVGSEDHDVGDTTCAPCAFRYPSDCECGGLIHGDINCERGQDLMLPVDQEALDTKRDRCGKSGQILRQRPELTPEERRVTEEIYEKLAGKKLDLGTSPDESEPSE